MPGKLQDFVKGNGGKVAAVVGIVAALSICVYAVRNSFGPPGETRYANDRMFIDAETGKVFEYTIKRGDVFPVKSPFTGKNTGYEAEKCYWTADGKIKKEPTYVLLNESLGKPGATFCPDCGRHVVRFNPPPMEGAPPPPKQSELKGKGRVSRED